MLNPAANAGRGGLDALGAATFTPEEQATLDKGKEIYTQLCFACHGDDGRGAPVPGAARHDDGAGAGRRRRACSAIATT